MINKIISDFRRSEAVQVRRLREMLQKIVGLESTQISSHGGETIRVWPLQITIQRENEIG